MKRLLSLLILCPLVAFGYTSSANDNTFNSEVMQSRVPVVVDFYASWCSHCQEMLPIFESTSHQYQGKVKFVTVNVDQSRNTAQQYNIHGIPTEIIFENGKVKATNEGELDQQELQQFINRNI